MTAPAAGGGEGDPPLQGDPPLERATVDPGVLAEFPGLELCTTVVEAGSGPTPSYVRDRMRYMSDRFHGARAVTLRTEPVPSAYRAFFRQIGLDPDRHRTPAEEVALRRVRDGGFRSRNLLDDALTVAIAETGAALWAYDADRVSGTLALRPARAGEREDATPQGRPLAAGTLVVADDRGPVARLFCEATPSRGVTAATARTLLCGLRVAGVPPIVVEEALWACAAILAGR